MKDNYKKYYIYSTLYAVAFMFCSGSIMQAFLMNLGVSQQEIYRYESIVTAVQFIIIGLSVLFADKIKNTGKVMALHCIMVIPLFLVMIIANVCESNVQVFYALILGFAVLAYIFIGINNTVSYRFPYEIIEMSNYGTLVGTAGIITGVTTFCISSLYSFLGKGEDVTSVTNIFLGLAIVFLLVSAYSVSSCKKIIKLGDCEEKKTPKLDVEIFKNKKTWFLLLPNFLRGVATGIINLLAVIAVSAGIVETGSATKLVVILQIATLVGNFIFIQVGKKVEVQWIVLFSGIGMAVVLPFVVVFNNAIVFFAGYLILQLFRFISDGAIPVSVTKFIPYNQIGAYTSIRMMVFTLGTSMGPVLVGILEKSISYTWILTIAALSQIICNCAYFYV